MSGRPHIRCSEFDQSLLTYNGMKPLNGPGGKAINVGYSIKPGNKPPLLFSTSKSQTPFGARPYIDANTGAIGKTTMSINLDETMEKMLSGIDKFFWQKMVENSQQWFGKPTLTEETCKVYYEGCIKPSKNGYPPLFNVKFQKKLNIDKTESKQFNVDAFLHDGTPIVLDEDNIGTMIPPRSEVIAMIKLRTFYIIGNKNVYPSFDVVQLVITPAASLSAHLLLEEAGITPKLVASGGKRLHSGASEQAEMNAMMSSGVPNSQPTQDAPASKMAKSEASGDNMDVDTDNAAENAGNSGNTGNSGNYAPDSDNEEVIDED